MSYSIYICIVWNAYYHSVYTFNFIHLNFLEAFFLADGVLAVATAYKKEFNVTKCEEFPFNDGQWHSISICQVRLY